MVFEQYLDDEFDKEWVERKVVSDDYGYDNHETVDPADYEEIRGEEKKIIESDRDNNASVFRSVIDDYDEKRNSLQETLPLDEEEKIKIHIDEDHMVEQENKTSFEEHANEQEVPDDFKLERCSNGYNEGEHYQSEGNYYEDKSQYDYEEEYDEYNGHYDYPDWREIQQGYLNSRENITHIEGYLSQTSRQRQSNDNHQTEDKVSVRLYQHALYLKRKKEALVDKKRENEERIIEHNRGRKLCLPTKRTQHLRPREEKPSSTPRYQHLYDQSILKQKRELKRQEEQERLVKENNQLRLFTRASSRSRATSSGPRYIHLYEKAKVKQVQKENEEKERKRKEMMKAKLDIPERTNRLYELSRKSQQAGKQRRAQIASSHKKPERSMSVGARRKTTKPLDIRLYDRGMANMRALEMRRAEAAKERNDDEYKEPPILSITGNHEL